MRLLYRDEVVRSQVVATTLVTDRIESFVGRRVYVTLRLRHALLDSQITK